MEQSEERLKDTIGDYMTDIRAQLSQTQKSLNVIEEKLEQQVRRQRCFWIERLMYCIIVIGLIVAVIIVA